MVYSHELKVEIAYTSIYSYYKYLQQCDIAAQLVLMVPERYQLIELIPWIAANMEFLIHVPENEAANVDAISKPFQWTVRTIFILFHNYINSNKQHITF